MLRDEQLLLPCLVRLLSRMRSKRGRLSSSARYVGGPTRSTHTGVAFGWHWRIEGQGDKRRLCRCAQCGSPKLPERNGTGESIVVESGDLGLLLGGRRLLYVVPLEMQEMQCNPMQSKPT